MNREILGKQLFAMRDQRGFTAKLVSEKTGLLESTIERIEWGKFSFDIDILLKLTNAYGYEIVFHQKV